jgi:hypothetical protein
MTAPEPPKDDDPLTEAEAEGRLRRLMGTLVKTPDKPHKPGVPMTVQARASTEAERPLIETIIGLLFGCPASLAAGVNDLGGLLMNESISRAAGAAHDQELTFAKAASVPLELG